MKIYILGVGAIASNIAINLAFDRREDELVLVDYDKVEPRNYQFGTQQYERGQLGQNKVEALQFKIYQATGKTVGVVNQMIKFKNDFLLTSTIPGLLIDCLDNYRAREIVREGSRLNHISCLHIGFSPQRTFAIEWNENYKTPTDIISDFDICQAPSARSFIQYVAGLATIVIIEFLTTGKKLEIVGNRFKNTLLTF